jgi:hypothetical protein
MLVVTHERNDVCSHAHVRKDPHGFFSAVDDIAENVQRIVIGKFDFFQHGYIFFVLTVDVGHNVSHCSDSSLKKGIFYVEICLELTSLFFTDRKLLKSILPFCMGLNTNKAWMTHTDINIG